MKSFFKKYPLFLAFIIIAGIWFLNIFFNWFVGSPEERRQLYGCKSDDCYEMRYEMGQEDPRR